MVSRGLLVFSLVFLAFLVRYGQSFLVPRRLAARGVFDGAKVRSAGRPLLLLPEAAAEDAPSTLKPGGLPRPDFSSVEDMKAKFPARMNELYPGRRGFPRIADSYTQAEHDEAMLTCPPSYVKVRFENEAGVVNWIQPGDVWRGNTKHLPKTKTTPDFSSVEDMKAKFPPRMIELYPDRGGYPRIADNYTQAEHDEAMRTCSPSHVKVRFENENDEVERLTAHNVWTGESKHSTPAMKKALNDRRSDNGRISRPKGYDSRKLEIFVTDQFAAICGIHINHTIPGARFDFACDLAYSHDDSSMVYCQISVMRFKKKNGSMNSHKSIHDIKKYLEGGGAVILAVFINREIDFIHGEINRAYILLPSDLKAFNSTTQNMNQSTVFEPSPYCTREPWGGLSKVMSKYLCTTKDEMKAKMLEHIRTGDRKSLDELNSQLSDSALKELYYMVPLLKWLGDFAQCIHYPADIRIFGKLNVEFKLARLGRDKRTKRYQAQIRRDTQNTADFNKVRAFCFVVNDTVVNSTTNGATYIFVPSLTRSGTCAFAPTGSSKTLQPYRLDFGFYFRRRRLSGLAMAVR